MHHFEYFAPRTLDEAFGLLGRFNGQASIIAGGTDLIVEMKENIRRPEYLVDINKISGLDQLSYDEDKGLKIGAQTTVRQVELSPEVNANYPGLFQAVHQLGSIQVRHRATVVGNICRASPSADTPPPLIAAGAEVTIQGAKGMRWAPLEDFFTGPGETILAPDEIVTEIIIPCPIKPNGHVYLKHGRRKAMELATVGVAVALARDADRCRQVRIVLGAVAPTPIRIAEAETLLEGQTVNQSRIAAAAEAAMAAARPISDVRSSAEYRREMVGVLTERAVEAAWAQANDG